MPRNAEKDFDLERIYVASPCPAPWESMKGDDRKRLCEQCGLNVFNISGMSRSDAAQLIANREGRMCVRLHRRSDGTVITKDCPKGLRAYRLRVAKFAGSALAAILGLFSIGYGQRGSTGEYSQGVRSETSFEIPRIEGVVKDANGTPIADAAIAIEIQGGKVLTTKTDRKGRFRLMSFGLAAGPNKMRITAKYFASFYDEFTIGRREMLTFPVILQAGETTGVIELLPEPLIDLRKSEISTTVFQSDN